MECTRWPPPPEWISEQTHNGRVKGPATVARGEGTNAVWRAVTFTALGLPLPVASPRLGHGAPCANAGPVLTVFRAREGGLVHGAGLPDRGLLPHPQGRPAGPTPAFLFAQIPDMPLASGRETGAQ